MRPLTTIGTENTYKGAYPISQAILETRSQRLHLKVQTHFGQYVGSFGTWEIMPPAQEVLAAEAQARRNGPNRDPNQDRIPTQQSMAFDDRPARTNKQIHVLVCALRRHFFDGGDALLNLADSGAVELRPPVEIEDAVLFRIDVGELGVAVAEHVGIVE